MPPDSPCTHHINVLRECLELVRFNNELNQCGPRLRELEHELEHAIKASPVACVPATVIELASEINVHLPGSDPERVGVLMFPTMSVCADCGSAHFTIPARKLRLLKARAPHAVRSTKQPRTGHRATQKPDASRRGLRSGNKKP